MGGKGSEGREVDPQSEKERRKNTQGEIHGNRGTKRETEIHTQEGCI